MQPFFIIRCFDQGSTKKILAFGIGLLALLSLLDLVYSGVLSQLMDLQPQNLELFKSSMVYFIITALWQIAVCIVVTLVLCGAFGPHATSFTFKLILGIVAVNLCLNFGGAVSAGIQSPYLTTLYSSYLSSNSKDDLTVKIKAVCGYTTFECIIGFILTIPINIILIIALTHPFWNFAGRINVGP